MALKRATIFVSGNVQMVGFRTFVKNLADSLDIKGYAENLTDGRVKIVCEGEEKSIEKLASSLKVKSLAFTKVQDLQMNYVEYMGEFVDFERRGKDIPKKATLDDLLNVMISFDKKAEKIVVVLGEIKDDTALIPAIKENTEKMLEKQDRMLEKQDTTIDILKGVKRDTAQILQHTSKIPMIAENTSLIPAIKEDTSEIKTNTREVVDKLQNKYDNK